MCNICNIRLPQAMGDVISSIGIGTAAADSIGYRVPARYRSNLRDYRTKKHTSSPECQAKLVQQLLLSGLNGYYNSVTCRVHVTFVAFHHVIRANNNICEVVSLTL